jgi:hypothetical protein
MEEVESIGSFEDEAASASGAGVALIDDPDSMDLLEEKIATVEAERACSTDMEKETEISSDLPVAGNTTFGTDDDQGYPGFEIWQDVSG